MALVGDTLDIAMGRAVRSAMVSADLTQSELAQRAEMSLQTLSRRVNGSLPFTWPELVRIAAAVSVTPAELVEAAEKIVDREQQQVPA